MAHRRMLAIAIIDSDTFLEMSPSAQALYFHLTMRADDDGFVNSPKKIQRIVGAKPGAGKSVFGMMVAMNAASSGRSSGVCSLEMLDIQYGQRVIKGQAGHPGGGLPAAAENQAAYGE